MERDREKERTKQRQQPKITEWQQSSGRQFCTYEASEKKKKLETIETDRREKQTASKRNKCGSNRFHMLEISKNLHSLTYYRHGMLCVMCVCIQIDRLNFYYAYSPPFHHSAAPSFSPCRSSTVSFNHNIVMWVMSTSSASFLFSHVPVRQEKETTMRKTGQEE